MTLLENISSTALFISSVRFSLLDLCWLFFNFPASAFKSVAFSVQSVVAFLFLVRLYRQEKP
jgi:hypothetical protein